MYKLSIILLSLIAGSAFGASTNNLLRSTEINLLQLMVDTRADQRANPEQSLACFDYYLKVFDDLNEEYRLSFAACLDTADVERRKIDAATQPERDAIEKSANSSCEALNVCANLVGSIEYFSCFSSTGKRNTESMYEISADAGESLANVRESYRLIENAEHRCTNASEREYVENTYKTNLELQSCLRGETAVPTIVAPTEIPTSTQDIATVTTEEPETTAASTESISDTPETTAASTESISDAPETATEGDFMPEEDLFAMRKLLAKLKSRLALSKY
nr:uncharacterized protein LOC106627254 [Bactrocera oleae]